MVYMSINNISNFRELTEKRILEEEKSIHEDYSSTLHQKLKELTVVLHQFILQDSVNPKPLSFKLDNELVSNFMVLGKNGDLLRPHFSIQKYNPLPQSESILFQKFYRNAEHAEFITKQLKQAELQYKRALEQAVSPLDSVRALSAQSRVLIKMNSIENALEIFRTIISEFGNYHNSFGIPFAYFSIDQLLKLENLDIKTHRTDLLQEFIEQISLGNIPFTNQTESLLNSYEFLISNETSPTENNSVLLEELKNIRAQAIQIQKYRTILLPLIDNTDAQTLPQLNDFRLRIPEEKQESLLLTRFSNDRLYSFHINLNAFDLQLRNLILKKDWQFDYQLELQDRTSNVSDLEVTRFQGNFSSYFPDKNLRVQLNNENAISEFVFNRTLVIIIGLILLLAAMVIGLMMLVRDVTRKRQIEKLRANFVANVTHELKTPLTSINMFADSILLDRVKTKEGLKKYAQIIVKESEKLKRMINNILEFSRGESNKLQYDLIPTNVTELIKEVMEEMNYWLKLHNFEIELALEENLETKVDVEGFKQVLSNLITNAIKYSLTDKKVVIRAYEKGEKICVEVEDHGIGIPANQLESVFKKFYRVKNRTSNSISGTGLGLTVSRDIVEAMGGALKVRSHINEGSVFTIILNPS